MKIIRLFKSKKIVHSKHFQPGELLKTFTYKGRRFIRIAFSNKKKYPGFLPITDVALEDVTGIRVVPSPAQKWLFRLVGKKARGKFYVINRSKN